MFWITFLIQVVAALDQFSRGNWVFGIMFIGVAIYMLYQLDDEN